MSVLIKGMKMPENCDECPLGEYEDSEWFSCNPMNMSVRHIAQCDRLDDCPLVELPEKHGDTIYRQAAIDAMANTLWHYPNECYRNLNEYEFAKGLAELGLKSVPSAQPERKKGKWIVTSEFEDCRYAKCNQCKVTQVFYYNKPLTNFCPNCGADMRGESK